jgi:fimbrial chaperone protein
MRRFAHVALVLALFGLDCGAARAGALQVSPLGVRLSDERPIATLRVRNVDDHEVIMQADVFAWMQLDGEDAYAATDEVVVIPPIFSLAPGAQQLLRIGLPEAMPLSEVERAFRVFLRELQQIDGQRDGGLNLALRIGLPIFVPPSGTARAAICGGSWWEPSGRHRLFASPIDPPSTSRLPRSAT